MVARVRLIKEENTYWVLTYFNSSQNNSDIPNMRTFFSYANNKDQKKTLKKARDFGKGIAKANNTTLEESLEENTD